jgi:hypothetical protein
MAISLSQLSVFISCPSDLASEKKIVISALEELNPSLEAEHAVTLRSLTWEGDVVPGIGTDAQNVINSQLGDKYDIYIGLLGIRFGTETPRAGSGTEEEFDGAYRRFCQSPQAVRVLFYFKTDVHNIHRADIRQLQKVQAFREKLTSSGMLFSEFSGSDDLLKQVRTHIRKLVVEQWEGARWKVLSSAAAQPAPPLATAILETTQETQRTVEEMGLSLVEDDAPGFLDLVVSAETATSTALAAITNIGAITDSYTLQLGPITQEIQSSASQHNARGMKIAYDKAANVMSRYASDSKREILIFRDSVTEALSLVEGALNMYPGDQASTVEQLTSLIAALQNMTPMIRGNREVTLSLNGTISVLPDVTLEFKRAKRNALQVFADTAAIWTLLLDRVMTVQDNLSKRIESFKSKNLKNLENLNL